MLQHFGFFGLIALLRLYLLQNEACANTAALVCFKYALPGSAL